MVGFLIFVVAGVVGWLFMRRKKQPVSSAAANSKLSPLSAGGLDDYSAWVRTLITDYPNLHEFDLFGTQAAILWRGGDPEVYVVCKNRFTRGQPEQYSKHDYFGYNVQEKYWLWSSPKGVADRVKDEIKLAVKVPVESLR